VSYREDITLPPASPRRRWRLREGVQPRDFSGKPLSQLARTPIARRRSRLCAGQSGPAPSPPRL